MPDVDFLDLRRVVQGRRRAIDVTYPMDCGQAHSARPVDAVIAAARHSA